MKIDLPYARLTASKDEWLLSVAKKASRFRELPPESYVEIDLSDAPEPAVSAIREIAKLEDDQRLIRTLDAIERAKAGNFDKSLPNFDAFMPSLIAYLKQDMQRGWVFREYGDGKLYPYLITSIKRYDPVGHRTEDKPSVRVGMIAYGVGRDNRGRTTESVSFEPADVTRKRIPDILSGCRLYKETPELLAAYDAQMDRYEAEIKSGFAKQFTFEGAYLRAADSYWRDAGKPVPKRKVIHDSKLKEDDSAPASIESEVFDDVLPVPAHPVVRIFDLSDHNFHWVHSDFMKPYAYDKTLRDKLVLPQSHRDLLDVMTTDLDSFIGDIIEGKSAGNIILCKGIPGVGKTLTAEIYSELIECPLYSIHSGSLGTTSNTIESSLKTIFERQRRWGCVLLLDEADVFVVQRGNNIEQNAIVAEFLRVLEYFDGLLFMTTNRPDDIDEAIISRCAAIVHYDIPEAEDRMKIWLVMMTNYGVKEVRPSLLGDLVEVFPTIAPRDIKMLLRLALRVAKFHDEELTIDTFRKCAMFRAIEVKDTRTTSEMI